MELKSYLAIGLVALTFASGFGFDRYLMNKDIAIVEAALLNEQIEYKGFRTRTQAISENLSKQYEDRIENAKKLSDAETAVSKSQLAAVTRTNNGLRKELSTVRTSISKATRQAVEEYATVSRELLQSCTERLVWYATEADGHRIDATKFDRSWPTNQGELPK